VSEREHSERPWGNYTVLDDDEPDHKVKRLVVHPGKRLSYQRHSKRAEHWFIVAGTAQVTLDGVVTELHAGDSIDIPLESAHRVANAGDTDVVSTNRYWNSGPKRRTSASSSGADEP